MQLTIYLYDEVADIGNLLREPASNEPKRFTRQPRLALDFECVAIGTFRTGRPAWTEYLADYFDVDWRASVTNSAVLLAQAAGRWFAVTFGYGRHLLNTALLVPDFGLRVTGNSIDPGRITAISSIAMTAGSRRTTQRMAIPSSIRAFSVRVSEEWVRSLAGHTNSDLTRAVTGSQALSVTVSEGHTLRQLHELLEHLFDRYESDDYRAHFPFLDWFVALPTGDRRVARLDDEVVRRLRTYDANVGFIEPDGDPGDDVNYFYRICRPSGRECNSHDLSIVRQMARKYPDPLRLRVRRYSQQGDRLGTDPLRMHLSAEVALPGQGYFVLAEGRWFQIADDFRQELERRLNLIEEINHVDLDLPEWWHQHDEGRYNRLAAHDRDLLLMDARAYMGTNRALDRIEVCDLVTVGLDLICVKRQRRSAALSHLFGQGSVSANLYRTAEDYREFLLARVRRRWPDARIGSPRFVYAIGNSRKAPLREALPFFSRFNLCNHVDAIRDDGYPVVITRIPLTWLPKPPPGPRPPLPPAPRCDPSGQFAFDLE